MVPSGIARAVQAAKAEADKMSALVANDPFGTKLQANEARRREAMAKYKQISDAMDELILKRINESPVMPEHQRIGGSEAGIAAGIALLAQALGARGQYAQGALHNYLGGRQGQLDAQYAEDVNAANQAYKTKALGYDAEAEKLARDAELAQLQYQDAGKERTDIYSAMKARETQDAITARNDASNQSREAIAKKNDETKRFVANLQAETTKGKDFNQIIGQYNALREIGFDDATAQSMVSAQFDLKLAQVGETKAQTGLTNERAKTERESRDLKLAEIRSRIGANNARAKHTLAAMEVMDDRLALDHFKAASGMFTKDREYDDKAAEALIESLTKEWNDSKKYIRQLEKDVINADPDKKPAIQKLLDAEKDRYRKLNDSLYEAKQARIASLNAQPMSAPLDPTKLPGFPKGIKNPGKGAPPKGKIGK